MRKSQNMKRLIFYILVALVLVSCGTESGKFRLEGRLRNLNQGEFWVYSPDGGLDGIDTITVRNGRFSYELDLRDKATLVVVFPNYSEQAVFAESGSEVTTKGDATHLKEMTIEGTDENKQMTQLRMELNRLTPPEIPDAVEAFIREHPQSVASIYLLQRYFVTSREPDFQKAMKLTKLLLKENPDNGQLIELNKQLGHLQGGAIKSRMKKFTATDVKGRKVTESDLKSTLNVVSVWASWSHTSNDMQRRLKELKKKHGGRLSVVSICVDGNKSDCLRRVNLDSLQWSTICDGRMWDTPLLAHFGLADVPANVLINNKGVIIARNLSAQKLDEEINKTLK